ncbi:pitrilysin family protein [Xanthomonadaceae bacterium XH05]|nr:pitrilysin family protein [Xanthomonadaceae bacterium XH05]
MRISTLVVLTVSLATSLAHAGMRLPDAESFTLENGAQVLLVPKKDTPLVAARIAIRGGALADAPGKEGTAALLAEMLGKGAGERDATAFVNAAENVGGDIAFSADREALWVRGDFLAEDAALMFELLSDALLRPTLADSELEKLRTRAIQSLIASKDGDPRGLLGTYGNAWLFRDHPYGRPIGGDERSLAGVTPEDIEGYYRAHVGADRAIIAVVGDFEARRMRQAIESAFGHWGKATGELPQVSAQARESGPRVMLVDKPGATQTYFWIGTVGAAVDDPALEAQDLVQTLFGGRFTSMLNTELRVKSGLTYGARAQLERLSLPGSASYNSFTRTESTVQAIDLALEVQERLHTQAIPADQLESARRYVLGQFAPGYQTNAQIAGALATLALHGMSRDRIEGYGERITAVAPETIAAARRVFPQGRDYAMVIIGDAAKIAENIAKYGPVTRLDITAPGFVPDTVPTSTGDSTP